MKVTLKGYSIFSIGLVIAIIIAVTTDVTWIMAAVGVFFFALGEIAVDDSRTMRQLDDNCGRTFSGMIIALLAVCIGANNWWPLLHYGLPAILGLIIPGAIVHAKSVLTATQQSVP